MKLGIGNELLKLCVAAALSGPVMVVAGEPSHPDDSAHLNARLHGAYAVTTAKTCAQTNSPNTIEPPYYYFPNPSDTNQVGASDDGIMTFNGDGTATWVGTSRTVSVSGYSGTLVTITKFTAQIHYTVNPDGTVNTSTSSNFAVVFPTTIVNVTGTVAGVTGRLQIAAGGSMLVSAPSEEYGVETITFNSGRVFYRICARSFTMVKLGDDEGKSHGHDSD